MPFMRSLAQNGADVFVNLTNDSWFGPGNEPYQHLELAAHRTIENGRAMIRATNTGITTVIDATGKTLSSGRLFEAEIVRAKVPIYQEKINTFYLKYGELFSWLILVLTFLLGGWAHLLFNRGVQKP
jgi:apolipoprotein N-acyltransferase